MEFLINNLQTIITFAVIVVLLMLAISAWRAFSPRVAGGKRGQRLAISEYYEIDKLRRLVLVKRDNVEHLILIGGPQDIVIEQGIGTIPPAGTARIAPRAPAAPQRQEPEL